MSKTTGEISHFQSVRDFRIAVSDGATVVDSAGNLAIPVFPLYVTARYSTSSITGGLTKPHICVEVSDGVASKQLSNKGEDVVTENFSACKLQLSTSVNNANSGQLSHAGCSLHLTVNLRSVHYNTNGEAFLAVKGGIGSASGEYPPAKISLDVSWNGYKSNGSFRTCGTCGNSQDWFVIKIRKTNWSASAEYEIETIPSSGICGKAEGEINIVAPYRWCNSEHTVFTEQYPSAIGSYIWGKKEVNITYDPKETTAEEAIAEAALSKVASIAEREYFIGGTANTRYWRDEEKDDAFATGEPVDLCELYDSNMNTIYITYGINDNNKPSVVDYYTATGNSTESGYPIVIHGGTVACSYEIVYAQQANNKFPDWGVGFRNGYTIHTQSVTIYTDKVTEVWDDNDEPYYDSIDTLFEYYEAQATRICRGIDTHVRGSYIGAWDADGFLDYDRVEDAGVIELALSPVIRIDGVIYADVRFSGYVRSSYVVIGVPVKAYSTVPCGQQVTVYVREDTHKYYHTIADATSDTDGVDLPAIANGVYSMVSVAGNTYYFEQNLNETDEMVG